MRGSQYTVSDVMTSTVVVLAGGATFKEIVRTMRQWDVSAMPVLDAHGRFACCCRFAGRCGTDCGC
jgi:predicted transcriptional regulator